MANLVPLNVAYENLRRALSVYGKAIDMLEKYPRDAKRHGDLRKAYSNLSLAQWELEQVSSPALENRNGLGFDGRRDNIPANE